MEPVIAVVGNPNVGKTTLFNALTGLFHVTGNYPGVTVERKVGHMTCEGLVSRLIDLPGAYSLAARSPDEMIVVDVLLGQQAGESPVDAVLAVVDASNLNRNLYLVSQLRELGKPLVVALNMMDLAERRGTRIDVETIARNLGVPVVPVCAHRKVGTETLKQVLVKTVQGKTAPESDGPDYPKTLTRAVDALATELASRADELGRVVPRVEAFRILVDLGGYAEERLLNTSNGELATVLADSRRLVTTSSSLAALETQSRYAWIQQVTSGAMTRPTEQTTTFSDRLDQVLTHKVFGIIVFAALMAVVFQAIYHWAVPVMDTVDAAVGALAGLITQITPTGPIQSLLVDGLIAGVGSVLIFIPQILILTFFIALLEDCGYMARAAFLMDKLLSKVGLSGQSFIPLLSSFACAIPGIMASRTISNRRDRFATIMVAPLMSCSARLPVYTIMIAAFIPNKPLLGGLLGLQGVTLFAMYSIGILVAIPAAWLLKRTVLRSAAPPFLLELPSYKRPQLSTVLRKVGAQGKEFLKRAGTIICAISVIVWALAYFPHSRSITESYEAKREQIARTMAAGPSQDAAIEALGREEAGAHLRNSLFSRAGHAIEPLVEPLGWDWRIGMATIASFPAREIVVAVLGTIFNLGDEVDESSEGLHGALHNARGPDGRILFTIPSALSIMVFFALCCQCGATLVIIRRETGSWRWPLITFTYMTVLAYVGAFSVYQVATVLGLGMF